MNNNPLSSLQQRFKFGTKNGKSSSSSSNNVSPNLTQDSNSHQAVVSRQAPIPTVSASVSAKESPLPHSTLHNTNRASDHFSDSVVAIRDLGASAHNKHVSFEPLPFPNYSLFEESYGKYKNFSSILNFPKKSRYCRVFLGKALVS